MWRCRRWRKRDMMWWSRKRRIGIWQLRMIVTRKIVVRIMVVCIRRTRMGKGTGRNTTTRIMTWTGGTTTAACWVMVKMEVLLRKEWTVEESHQSKHNRSRKSWVSQLTWGGPKWTRIAIIWVRHCWWWVLRYLCPKIRRLMRSWSHWRRTLGSTLIHRIWASWMGEQDKSIYLR